MQYTRIYTDAAGETHFEDVEVETSDEGRAGYFTAAKIPVSAMVFRRNNTTEAVDWHPAPRIQFILIISGGTEVTVSDGETRRFEPGSICLVEDLTGKGHVTKPINDASGERWSLFIEA